jgi:hypothetical protein
VVVVVSTFETKVQWLVQQDKINHLFVVVVPPHMMMGWWDCFLNQGQAFKLKMESNQLVSIYVALKIYNKMEAGNHHDMVDASKRIKTKGNATEPPRSHV